jgi:hypothetical protein
MYVNNAGLPVCRIVQGPKKCCFSTDTEQLSQNKNTAGCSLFRPMNAIDTQMCVRAVQSVFPACFEQAQENVFYSCHVCFMLFATPREMALHCTNVHSNGRDLVVHPSRCTEPGCTDHGSGSPASFFDLPQHRVEKHGAKVVCVLCQSSVPMSCEQWLHHRTSFKHPAHLDAMLPVLLMALLGDGQVAAHTAVHTAAHTPAHTAAAASSKTKTKSKIAAAPGHKTSAAGDLEPDSQRKYHVLVRQLRKRFKSAKTEEKRLHELKTYSKLLRKYRDEVMAGYRVPKTRNVKAAQATLLKARDAAKRKHAELVRDARKTDSVPASLQYDIETVLNQYLLAKKKMKVLAACAPDVTSAAVVSDKRSAMKPLSNKRALEEEAEDTDSAPVKKPSCLLGATPPEHVATNVIIDDDNSNDSSNNPNGDESGDDSGDDGSDDSGDDSSDDSSGDSSDESGDDGSDVSGKDDDGGVDDTLEYGEQTRGEGHAMVGKSQEASMQERGYETSDPSSGGESD